MSSGMPLSTGEGSTAAATATPGSKPTRKQGVSCDACKFRKVKCDRRTKIESRLAHESEDNIACSVCSSHGLRCTYTQMAPKRRRGRRIVAIQRGQLEDIDDTTASQSSHAQQLPNFSPDVRQPAYAGQADASPSSSTSSSTSGLLGVRGMTRALLDACAKSYFKYAAPCMPILHAEIFAARYALFFSVLEKNKSIPPFWMEPQENANTMDRPLSELLLLAVGCIGAALLEPPIADFHSKAKFRLQDRLALQFQERLSKDDLLLRLQHEGTDVIEACYIMSDPTLTILGDDWPSRSTIEWETVSQLDRSQRDPLRLRPASHEGIVRLIFKMGINRRPRLRKDCPPGDNRLYESLGAHVTELETLRRLRIFWASFIQDSFRSMGERRNMLIGDDDYDLDLPRFVPRQDGFFTALLFYKSKRNKQDMEDLRQPSEVGTFDSPASVHMQPARFARFDAIQFEVMLRLAFIVRTVSIKFVSPRSQGRGVLMSDVERAVSALSAWYQQLPNEVTWEVQSEPLLSALQEGKSGSSNATAMRNSLKALFVEVLYHTNVLAVWASVDSFGTRADVDINDTVTLFTSRMRLGDEEQSRYSPSSASNPSTGPSPSSSDAYMGAPRPSQKAPEELRKAVKRKLDNLTSRSFLRVSKVAREAARVGLLRACRLVYVSGFSSFAVWGCGLARKMAANGEKALGEGERELLVDAPPGYNQTEYIFKCVENLAHAIGVIDSFEGAAERVAQIKDLLQKSRESVKASQSNSSPGLAGASSTSVKVDEEDSDSNSPVDEPFRYFFQTGGRRGLGNTTKGLGKPREQEEKGVETTEMDEVAQLAHAAMPYDSGLSLEEDATSSSADKSHETPDLYQGVPDQALDLDLESITGMDTSWLHQFLRGNARPLHPQMQPPQAQSTSHDAAFIPPLYHDPATSGQMGPSASEMEALYNFASSDGTFMDSNTVAPVMGTGIDVQWDQFMANSDAQIWADAQWQGFNVDSMMT